MKTTYDQTLKDSNHPIPKVFIWSLCPKRKCAPYFCTHRGSFELFNLNKQQRRYTHPKLPTSFGWNFFQANTWTTCEQTFKNCAFDIGQDLTLDQNGWVEKINHLM
jgi:hypothetical protein